MKQMIGGSAVYSGAAAHDDVYVIPAKFARVDEYDEVARVDEDDEDYEDDKVDGNDEDAEIAEIAGVAGVAEVDESISKEMLLYEEDKICESGNSVIWISYESLQKIEAGVEDIYQRIPDRYNTYHLWDHENVITPIYGMYNNFFFKKTSDVNKLKYIFSCNYYNNNNLNIIFISVDPTYILDNDVFGNLLYKYKFIDEINLCIIFINKYPESIKATNEKDDSFILFFANKLYAMKKKSKIITKDNYTFGHCYYKDINEYNSNREKEDDGIAQVINTLYLKENNKLFVHQSIRSEINFLKHYIINKQFNDRCIMSESAGRRKFTNIDLKLYELIGQKYEIIRIVKFNRSVRYDILSEFILSNKTDIGSIEKKLSEIEPSEIELLEKPSEIPIYIEIIKIRNESIAMIDTTERINNSMKIIDDIYDIKEIEKYYETIRGYNFGEIIQRLIKFKKDDTYRSVIKKLDKIIQSIRRISMSLLELINEYIEMDKRMRQYKYLKYKKKYLHLKKMTLLGYKL